MCLALVEDIGLTATSLVNKTAQASPTCQHHTHSAWLPARLCTANGIICARSLMQFITCRSTQRYNTSSIFDDLPLSHTSLITGDYIPSCHLCLSYSEHMYVCSNARTYGMLATLSSGVSTWQISLTRKICLYVQKDCEVCTGPIFLPLAITASTRS